MAIKPNDPAAVAPTGTPSSEATTAEDAPSRHDLAPDDEMLAFPLDSVKPYPDRVRFHVVWRSAAGRTLVAQNALAPVIPPPPDAGGPIGCDCRDHWDSTRYGSAQYDLRPWCPDFYRDGAGCVYAPDLFEGYGPCVKRSVPGLMTEWTDARTVITDDSIEFDPITISTLADYYEVAVDVLRFLGVDRAVHEPPSGAANQEDLWAAWSVWVRKEQILRAFILERLVGRDAYKRLQAQDRSLWERLCDCEYFAHGPVGAWFDNAELHLAQIRFLLARGVPVFYEWTPALASLPSAAFLAPANGAATSAETVEHISAGVATSGNKRKGSDPPATVSKVAKAEGAIQPDNVDRSRRVLFNDADSLGRALKDPDQVPATPKKKTTSTPSTPVRPLSDRFTMPAVLYPSSPRSPSPSASRSPALSRSSAPLRDRITSPDASTLSGGSRESSPAPPSDVVPASLLARIQHAAPAPAVGIIEVVALSNEVGKPMHIETVAGALRYADIKFLPFSPTLTDEVLASTQTTPAVEYHIRSTQSPPRLVIPANGRAHEILWGAVARKEVRNWVECMVVALQYGITIYTGIDVDMDSAALSRAIEARDSQAIVRVSPDLSATARYASWRESVKSVFVKASAFRAAMRSGGLLWRIGRWFNTSATVDSHPTNDVYQHGSPAGIVVNGHIYHDDWLSIDEERILLGWSPKLLPTHISLWPPTDLWTAHWGGIWTDFHESWFPHLQQPRVTVLQAVHDSPRVGTDAPRLEVARRSALNSSWTFGGGAV